MAVRIGTFMQPKSALAAMLTQGALKLFSVLPPVRDYVLQLRFKPKPRFFEGFFVRHADKAGKALVPAGQLLPQPRVELPGGAQAALDDVLGSGFALLSLADAEDSSVTAVLTALAATGLACRHIQVVSQSDDFLRLANQSTLRDCGGTLEAIIRSAGAQAVLLRPDRYVLAYLDRSNPSVAARLQQLLRLSSIPQAA
jgi:3-(3-hydroxy-phenyl)propionate hydroxylase